MDVFFFFVAESQEKENPTTYSDHPAAGHGHALMLSLLSDFDKQVDCDVFFSVQGKSIGAHKKVLQVRGGRLYELSTQQTKDTHSIDIQSMDFAVFKKLLR